MSKDNLNSEEILNDNSKRKKERDDYFLKLEKWLQEAYAWQSAAATVPYYFMSGQLLHQAGKIYRSIDLCILILSLQT